jgi:predicted phage tail protein
MEQPTIKRILLYGHLRARFGKEFRLAVDSTREAIRALNLMVPGFQ